MIVHYRYSVVVLNVLVSYTDDGESTGNEIIFFEGEETYSNDFTVFREGNSGTQMEKKTFGIVYALLVIQII